MWRQWRSGNKGVNGWCDLELLYMSWALGLYMCSTVKTDANITIFHTRIMATTH
jgi:hypothetical protein